MLCCCRAVGERVQLCWWFSLPLLSSPVVWSDTQVPSPVDVKRHVVPSDCCEMSDSLWEVQDRSKPVEVRESEEEWDWLRGRLEAELDRDSRDSALELREPK